MDILNSKMIFEYEYKETKNLFKRKTHLVNGQADSQ
jgi:hypothetical protein